MTIHLSQFKNKPAKELWEELLRRPFGHGHSMVVPQLMALPGAVAQGTDVVGRKLWRKIFQTFLGSVAQEYESLLLERNIKCDVSCRVRQYPS